MDHQLTPKKISTRQKIERAIVTALIAEANAAGFVPVSVYDGGEYVPDVAAHGDPADANKPEPVALTTDAVLDAVFAVDVSTIHFAPTTNLLDWGNRGVFIVLGNGEDCISDWHNSNDAFNAAVEKTCDRIPGLTITV
jgi:hypothetical protein